MGYWGVKSFENDGASDAIDAGLERVHGAVYDDLMDDRNPLGFDDAQRTLANPQTLAAAIDALREEVGPNLPWDDWDDTERLAFAGVVVRHAEFGVPIPEDLRERAIAWLASESLDWEGDATVRRLRRDRELQLLRAAAAKGTQA